MYMIYQRDLLHLRSSLLFDCPCVGYRLVESGACFFVLLCVARRNNGMFVI